MSTEKGCMVLIAGRITLRSTSGPISMVRPTTSFLYHSRLTRRGPQSPWILCQWDELERHNLRILDNLLESRRLYWWTIEIGFGCRH
jgi:hypothetical protein